MISGDQLLTAFFTFLVALATIAVLMRLVKFMSFLPFSIYRVALGIILLALPFFGFTFGAVQ
jgi:undecaprenyl-diphosphatase